MEGQSESETGVATTEFETLNNSKVVPTSKPNFSTKPNLGILSKPKFVMPSDKAKSDNDDIQRIIEGAQRVKRSTEKMIRES